jgi:hypothetical protein
VTEQPYAIVRRAVDKTRSHAGQQALGCAALTAGLVVVNRGFPWWVVVFIVLNTWVTFTMGRRWFRLRKTGRVLLEAPSAITHIRAWPPKLPPERMPLMLEAYTKDGSMCSLQLDPKKPAEASVLAAALKARSPDAAYIVPNVPLPVSDSSPAT